MHNQLPELYCNNSVDPGVDRYPGDMVDRCPEGAGGGNVRTYLCTPDGRVLHLTLGYWRKERFLRELDHADAIWRARTDVERVRTMNRERGVRVETVEAGGTLATAQRNMIARGHREAAADAGKPIIDVLGRIEDEIFLSGKIG